MKIASAGLPCSLSRRHDEDAKAHVRRLLTHELCLGADDHELASLCNTTVAVVRDVRAEALRSTSVLALLADARRARIQLGFSGSVFDLLRAALRDFVERRQRLAKAPQVETATSQRPRDQRGTTAQTRPNKPGSGGAPATVNQARVPRVGTEVAAKAAG